MVFSSLVLPMALHDLDRPMPLKRQYLTRILPGLGLFLCVLVVFSAYTSSRIVEAGYLRLGEERANALQALARRSLDNEWDALLRGEVRTGSLEWVRVTAFLNTAIAHARLAKVKVYDAQGRVRFSNNIDQVGELENNPPLDHALTTLEPALKLEQEADGEAFYELYVPLMDPKGHLRGVVELYEVASQYNTVLLKSTLASGTTSGVMLLILIALLTRLVTRAQKHIDFRTGELVSLRQRLESFLSDAAVGAAHEASGGQFESRRVQCVILYTDIRDYTGYAENHDPEAVVDFLNAVFASQTAAAEGFGGVVDKFVGDAMLAWFRGPEAEARALAAACRMIEEEPENARRSVGIGVFSGSVILGAVGPAHRRDYTIIGDAVNTAARFCSKARGREIVADAATVERAGEAGEGFGSLEQIEVKGKTAPLSVRRWVSERGPN